jgi:hypothetical protein
MELEAERTRDCFKLVDFYMEWRRRDLDSFTAGQDGLNSGRVLIRAAATDHFTSLDSVGFFRNTNSITNGHRVLHCEYLTLLLVLPCHPYWDVSKNGISLVILGPLWKHGVSDVNYQLSWPRDRYRGKLTITIVSPGWAHNSKILLAAPCALLTRDEIDRYLSGKRPRPHRHVHAGIHGLLPLCNGSSLLCHGSCTIEFWSFVRAPGVTRSPADLLGCKHCRP